VISKDYCVDAIPFINKWYDVDKDVDLHSQYRHSSASPEACSKDLLNKNTSSSALRTLIL